MTNDQFNNTGSPSTHTNKPEAQPLENTGIVEPIKTLDASELPSEHHAPTTTTAQPQSSSEAFVKPQPVSPSVTTQSTSTSFSPQSQQPSTGFQSNQNSQNLSGSNQVSQTRPMQSSPTYTNNLNNSGSIPPVRPQASEQHRSAAPVNRIPSSQIPNRTMPHHNGGGAQTKGSKVFLMGFLGALVASVLVVGGFFAISSVTKLNSSSTIIGASNSSVINAAEEGKTLAESVAAKALPSVVAVYNYTQASSSYGFNYNTSKQVANSDNLTKSSMGSGVLISDDGYIITNYHVVENAKKITIKVGDEERDATYVGGDQSSDVAVIKVDNIENLKPVDLGNSDELTIGEWVMTVGAPLGLEQSVATGIVSATNRSTIMDNSSSNSMGLSTRSSSSNYIYYPNMIQTDAVINPGNSGGALVDSNGKLIGINTIISSVSGDYAGVGFAIPVNYAVGIAKQIIDGKEPTHAMLGVSISSVNSSIAKRYGFSADSGAYIASISDNTGASKADLQVGDIITAINGKSVTSTTDVTLEVRAHNPGDSVVLTINREGKSMDVPVTLSSDEGQQKSQDQNDSGSGNSRNRNQGDGGSGSNGYNMQDIEDILRMFGM